MARGDWLNPDRGRVPFGEYAARWVAERDLSETTRERYDQVLRVHLLPTFGTRAVAEIHEADVRAWRKQNRDVGVGQSTAAKAYRLLHAILHTAADDGLVRRNPCRIRGAGEEKSAERAVLSVDQVLDIPVGRPSPRHR